jgi:excisionase family DNA binding protein
MEEPFEQEITLPRPVAQMRADMLAELANGNAVSLVPMQAEFTTQQAADVLGVSRPYLVGLLERGQISFRRVGNRRRVPVADLLRYRAEQDDRTRAAIAALTEQAEELGLGYDD